MGRRGVGIKKRIGKDIEALFRQPIKLFINEYPHKLSYTIPLHGLLSYIAENNVGHIVLVDQLNTLRGVVTERCIIDRLEAENFGIKVSDIMTSQVYSVKPVHTIIDALDIMSAHRIRRVPILDEEKVIGIVTATDILRHLMLFEYHIEAILSKNDIKQFLMSSIGDIEFSHPSSIHPEKDLGVLIKQLKETEYTGFPIIKDKKLMGIISSRDMVIKTPKLIGVDRFTASYSES
jgi:CBS domain-containing protein